MIRPTRIIREMLIFIIEIGIALGFLIFTYTINKPAFYLIIVITAITIITTAIIKIRKYKKRKKREKQIDLFWEDYEKNRH